MISTEDYVEMETEHKDVENNNEKTTEGSRR